MIDRARERFGEWVHDAYNHLYDSHHLQQHPLMDVLVGAVTVEADSFQRSQALRRLLLDAIQSLRPQPGVPAQSPDWRIYSLLELRYIERLSPSEAMQQLALGKSQFFRDQARALDTVTNLLWAQVPPEEQRSIAAGAPDGETRDDGEPAERSDQLQFHPVTWRLIQLSTLLDDLLPVIQPLAESHAVHIELASLYSLSPVRADRVMLRQALLNILTFAVTSTASRRVDVTGASDDEHVHLSVAFAARPALGAQAPIEPASETGHRLALAAQIMEAMGGTLTRYDDGGRQTISLSWPALRPKTLLMIDDNEGLADLFRRYLAGEPWQIVWAKNGAEARQHLAELRPAAILLDIMMPEEDGWEILVNLKQRPETRDFPVLICSVVNEPTLGQSLGAAGYLAKPVSQESLLAALAQWQ